MHANVDAYNRDLYPRYTWMVKDNKQDNKFRIHVGNDVVSHVVKLMSSKCSCPCAQICVYWCGRISRVV